MPPRNLPDLWDGCYDGEHRQKMSPQQFKETFCAQCLNAGCKNSKAAGSKWIQRMLTQEDRLLDNPNFADPRDPQFQRIREQDFQDMLRHALAIEVSSQKGDWSVPTASEIGAAAAQMVGMVPPPSGFQAPSEEPTAPEPEEEPEPPARLVDEVQEYDLGREEPPRPVLTVSDAGDYAHLGTDKVSVSAFRPTEGLAGVSHDLPHLDEEGHMAPADAEKGLLLPPDIIPENKEVPQSRWRIRGDTGTVYDVVLRGDDTWECSCPSRENPCKHARDIALKLTRAPQGSAGGEDTPQETEPPQHPTRPPPGPASFVPRTTNTIQHASGQMIGGGPPPPSADQSDPWAAPPAKQKEHEIPVGGRVSFGSGKKR